MNYNKLDSIQKRETLFGFEVIVADSNSIVFKLAKAMAEKQAQKIDLGAETFFVCPSIAKKVKAFQRLYFKMKKYEIRDYRESKKVEFWQGNEKLGEINL